VTTEELRAENLRLLGLVHGLVSRSAAAEAEVLKRGGIGAWLRLHKEAMCRMSSSRTIPAAPACGTCSASVSAGDGRKQRAELVLLILGFVAVAAVALKAVGWLR